MSTTTTTESTPAQETEHTFPHKFNSGDILYADDLNTMTSAIVSALNVTTTIGTAFSYKGSVSAETELPKTAANGDVYNVEDTGMNYVYTGIEWDPLGASLDGYATNEDIDDINDNIATLTNIVNLKANQTDLTTVTANITSLSNTVNEHTDSITNLTTSVNEKANQTDLNAVSEKVDTNIANIANLTTSVNEHTDSITNLTTSVNEKAKQTDLDELSDTVEKMITFVKWTE